jgi:hypothetical protein
MSGLFLNLAARLPEMSVINFGLIGDGVTINDSALASAMAYISAQASPPALVFPTGIYCFKSMPNLALTGFKVRAAGHVVIRNKGTGNAVTLDGGAASPAEVQDFTFGTESNPFVIESPTGGGHAIFTRALLTGCVVSAIVRGAGAGSAGLVTNWCVSCKFNVSVAPYQAGWYNDGNGPAVPMYGAILTQRNAGEQTTYCSFNLATMSACQYGWYIDEAFGIDIFNGDTEYNTVCGMELTANASQVKVFGMDFEQNTGTGGDISCAGSYNEFSCNTASLTFLSGATANEVTGGNHQTLTNAAGAVKTLFAHCKVNKALSGGGITDAGTNTRYRDVYDMGLQTWYNSQLGDGAISVTASPFTYTNTSGREQAVFVQGGTISNMTYYRGATALGTLATNSTVRLSPGDSLSITYSAAPTMKYADV